MPKRNSHSHAVRNLRKFDGREEQMLNSAIGAGNLTKMTPPLSEVVLTDALELGFIGIEPIAGLGGGYYDPESLEQSLHLPHLSHTDLGEEDLESDDFLK